ncbi:hypothetical protein S83_005287, partial [Arachis hypogaea]
CIYLILLSCFGLLVKEKRWVVFNGEEDPTSIPVEWISWLNGQRKKAPTPESLIGSEVEESSGARGSLRSTQENKTEKEKVEP